MNLAVPYRSVLPFASLQFQPLNTGLCSYQGDHLVGPQATDAAGQAFYPTIVTGAEAGPRMNSGTSLLAGDKALAFITFEIPSSSKNAQAQYNLNSVMYGARYDANDLR